MIERVIVGLDSEKSIGIVRIVLSYSFSYQYYNSYARGDQSMRYIDQLLQEKDEEQPNWGVHSIEQII